MLELPESVTIARQLNETVRGKQVASLETNHTPHGFAWLNGSTADYTAWLCGKTFEHARGLPNAAQQKNHRVPLPKMRQRDR